ncbi:Ubiquitin carboxyl-terminal hydrolase-related protein [Arabidopsis thaliana]|uniref:Ubiquitin carboxyl-terminal hydrolase-related protein n=1 Tax=Arabidopsis thaliana TaxID=3702 RepID=A0A1P8AN28_ARATH|nr:Ubiquitin carboxyl-terminal hydrolase-related protein [Arabidopsis thaliana]ANM58055.1 Ubiquitin carboxyl-terminal hydrolase-related protein [Arabidopsis thaliana]|eukprot:NP_001320519.1 Ubiquitin carboxyl-terminal hydrolase-related protein [Arabidopsis thaliana]
MESSSSITEGKPYKDANDHIAKGNYIEALKILEDLIRIHREDQNAWLIRIKQGQVFLKLSLETENSDMEFTYLLGSVGCYSEDERLSPFCANSLHMLANKLGSLMYYKKCLVKAKLALSVTFQDITDPVVRQIRFNEKQKQILRIIKDAESKIASPETLVASTMKQVSKPKVLESEKIPETRQGVVKRLRSFWVGLDVKVKRDFMKVNIAKLLSFVERVRYRDGRDVLENVLASARKDMIWTFWMCCSKRFSSAEECKNHLEEVHAADFKPGTKKDKVQRIGKDWARKISNGSWEPVDAAAAVEMIKNQLADVKAFASKCKNGWSKEWPLAADEERGKLLKEIKLLLVSLCDHKTLSCSVRDWVMYFPVKHLEKLEVSAQSLVDSLLVETPQSICFLECPELNQILDFLNNLKCERNDGAKLVSRAVDSFLDRTRVKENIDFDPQFSYLLLDRRLLKSNNAPCDDERTINVFDPIAHYAKAHAQGDDIIPWLYDNISVDKIFPKPIREYNLDIWLAVLRAVQFTCRNLETKYTNRKLLLGYVTSLMIIERICMSEDERRRNLQEDQWIRYASILCDECEEILPEISVDRKIFLGAVRDVLEGALLPPFDVPDLDDCLNLIREQKSCRDDKVLESIGLLTLVVTHKVLLIDSKILLIENSRISLLNNLARLSAFDNRTYILQLMKPFLLNEIMNMERKAKADAVAADLALEEEKKAQSKKKNDKINKRASMSKFSPLDQTVEHKPPVNLELKTVEEDSMEPENALASESGPLESSSKTQNQEEATKDGPAEMLDMPKEDSLSAHSESAIGGAAARYNSALDMTLKALLNIKVLKEDLKNNTQRFQQVPSALQHFFNAFVSESIKTEGVYSCILSDLLSSLEEVISMSSDAAKVVVAILEFWCCWKNPEGESLVTRLFTLAENERMSCRKCRWITNYPEKSSYAIVMPADSIRQLKCAFESMKFVDILKVIRMEYQKSCNIKTGGCGESNFVHHFISRCPPVFTIVLEWEKSETEKEISETTKALDLELDISRLYVGLEPNTNYRLVSMVGCGEEEEHFCLAYENNRWVNLGRESLAGEDVSNWKSEVIFFGDFKVNLRQESLSGEDDGNWKSVVSFFGERKIRPEILFYEAVGSMA